MSRFLDIFTTIWRSSFAGKVALIVLTAASFLMCIALCGWLFFARTPAGEVVIETDEAPALMVSPARLPPSSTIVPDVLLTPVIVSQPTTDSDVPSDCTCSGNTYNCSHFSTQKRAQSCYDYCLELVGRDVYRLDGNGDGIVCETLPGGD